MSATAMPLSPLTKWCKEHIQDIFESKSDTKSMLAIEQTFATSLKATINGKVLPLEELKKLVQALRNSSSSRSLKIEWQKVTEFPADEHNSSGDVDGTYVIHGIFKQLPGFDRPVQFARHKITTVRVESLPEYGGIDCRRIVELNFTASDNRVVDRAYYKISFFLLFFMCSVGVVLYYFRPASIFRGLDRLSSGIGY